ncbi:ABC transporter substrate-binding protein [Lentibacillus sp. N15]|uniref:ABC transporter substrate-binding protein n=1 Tax=Lentibacillus songyuanensis TaxID=3136161 RepID=UPI0031BB4B54
MKRYTMAILAIIFLIILGACGTGEKSDTKKDNAEDQQQAGESADGERVIKQLGKEYTVPEKVERIVIVGAIEAMEDSMVLDVKPVGASTTGGEFPKLFTSTVLSDAEPIGEKTEPNVESILQLKPDVILMSTKFPEETTEKMEKLAPVIPISHISDDWKDNLETLAALTGKEDVAKKALQSYEKQLEDTKAELSSSVKDEKVLAIRIRNGDIFIYPENVFLNASLYEDLGYEAPEEVKAAKAQEMLPLEKLSEIDPDYIFVQFEASSNQDDKNALKDLAKNPIWQSLKAVKNDHVFENVIDPILEGGPLYSRTEFLKAASDKLSD